MKAEERQATVARIKAITASPEFSNKHQRAHEQIAAQLDDGAEGDSWFGVYGDRWILGSPITIQELHWGDYRIDCVVDHKLRPLDTYDGGIPPEEARPVVRQITRLERIDRAPLGHRDLALDLNQIAIDAVVAAARNVIVRRASERGWSYDVATSEEWRDSAQAVRVAAIWFGGRMRWTDALSRELVHRWRHLVEHGCGTAADLGAAFGTTARPVQTQLNHLRNQGWDVPRGRPGRRVRKDEHKE